MLTLKNFGGLLRVLNIYKELFVDNPRTYRRCIK